MAKSALKKMARNASKSASKQVGKQVKNLSKRSKKSPLSKAGKALPSGGGLIAGAVGTVVGRRAVKAAGERVRSAVERRAEAGSPAAEKLQAAAGNGGSGQDAAPKDEGSGTKQDTANVKLREIVQEYIDVSVPREFAYSTWKDYESLPGVFKGIDLVEDDDGEQKWQAKIGPARRQWKSEVKEDVEERKIGWEATGEDLKGIVAFHELGENLTRIMVQMEYHPKGAVSSLGNLLRMQRRRVRRDLRLFKHHVELKAEEGGSTKTKSSSDTSEGSQGSGGADQGDPDTQGARSGTNGSSTRWGNNHLKDRNVEELRKAASVLGIKDYRSMNKQELVTALEGR